ncbi:uncharacterized protein LOC144106992 [Amblyomma americanum]
MAAEIVVLDGVQTLAYPELGPDGMPVFEEGLPVYVTDGGVRLRLAIREQEAAGAVGSDSAESREQEAAAVSSDSAQTDELWPKQKTLLLIQLYKEFKESPGRRLKTKKQMWEMLAAKITEVFGGNLTPSQIENKWRTLERGYKRVREHNSRSGNDRRSCEFEE